LFWLIISVLVTPPPLPLPLSPPSFPIPLYFFHASSYPFIFIDHAYLDNTIKFELAVLPRIRCSLHAVLSISLLDVSIFFSFKIQAFVPIYYHLFYSALPALLALLYSAYAPSFL
jgi:hypothetical protein